jgi:hypothetical protein
MKQAIAGVAPPDLKEVTIMTVWPTNAVTGLGRWLGTWYESRAGFGKYLTVGKLALLLSIPLALGLFFFLLKPGFNRRYRLTNRRLILERGYRPVLEKGPQPVIERFVLLDDFDTIDIVILPGQSWYHSGEMIFRKGALETFRLSGVSRPETFRRTCLEAQRSFSSVKHEVAKQLALV